MKNIFKNWNNLRNGSFSLKISKYSGPKIAHHSNLSSGLYSTNLGIEWPNHSFDSSI